MKIFELISLLGLIQAILISYLIFKNKIFRDPVNQYFAFFLLILAIIGLDSLLSQYYHKLGDFWFILFDILGDDIPWIMMFYLPLFTFFLKSTKKSIRVPLWYFYMPFFIFIIINVLIDLDFDFGLISVPWLTSNRVVFYELEDYISFLLFSILHLFIFFYAIRQAANPWIQKLWWYCSALILIWTLLIVSQAFLEDQFLDFFILLLWTTVFTFAYWLMYTGLFQFNLANNRHILKEKLNHIQEQTDSQKPPSRISKSYYDRLLDLLDIQAVYRNPNLGREDLAKQLGISPGYLTQLIKENTDQSFTSFVNQYRVKDVEKMLIDPAFESYDILSIGLEAGFKSKSAFFTTFKNFTGLTPRQYQKKKF